jgi:Superinfection immunity protein
MLVICSDSLAIFGVNLLLGWTVLGWFAALAMACRTPRRPEVITADHAAKARPRV